MKKHYRRFIAGAVCPRCAQIDKLTVTKTNTKLVRECVRCGYHDVMETKDDTEKRRSTTSGEAIKLLDIT